MDIQMKLGADIAMVFDECLAYGTDKSYAEKSVARTTRWERRSKAAHTRGRPPADERAPPGLVHLEITARARTLYSSSSSSSSSSSAAGASSRSRE